jgi:hypothetical protein
MKHLTIEQYRRSLPRSGYKNFDSDNKPKIKRRHEEDDLTIQVANYLDLLKLQGKILQFTHISNETYTKYWTVKAKNKAKGVRPGIPDFLIVLSHGVVFIELKKVKGGVVSDNQKAWLESILRAGSEDNNTKIAAEVAKGWDEARKTIDKYINLMS